MKASDIMTVSPVTVRPDSTVAYAARLMIERGVSGLPVVSTQGALVGVITEHDLLRRRELGTDCKEHWLDFWLDADEMAHHYAREHGRKVEDAMSRDVVSVSPDEPLETIVKLMESNQVKRLPVVSGGRVIGIVSRANVLSALARLMGEAPQPVVDDLAIRKSIMDEITGKSWTPGASVDIAVRNGVVTLTGTAPTEHLRDAVRVAAENAPGTVRVWDQIRVISGS